MVYCDWLEVFLSCKAKRLLEESVWFEKLKIEAIFEDGLKGRGWEKNGHKLFFSNFQGKKLFNCVIASGELGDELLTELSKMNLRDSDFVVKRIDIKTKIKAAKIKNWENLMKRQTLAEEKSKHFRFRRKVKCISSARGNTLAIGTRGNATYCRFCQSKAENEEDLYLEQEYRKDKAKKLGEMLIGSKQGKKGIMAAISKDYLKSVVQIRGVTKPLLEALSFEVRLAFDNNGTNIIKNKMSSDERKRNYFKFNIVPFLKKLLKNPILKEDVAETLFNLLHEADLKEKLVLNGEKELVLNEVRLAK